MPEQYPHVRRREEAVKACVVFEKVNLILMKQQL
jgi:hypothetical protein